MLFRSYPALLFLCELWKFERRAEDSESPKRSLLWLLAGGGAFGVFLLWRYRTFGALLPNTFLAKPPGSGDLEVDNNPFLMSLDYLGEFVLQCGVLLPALALGCLRKNLRRDTAVVGLFVGAGFIFGLYTGGDWMPEGRYYLPIYPLVIVASCVALGGLKEVRLLRKVSPGLRGIVLALPIIAAFGYSAFSLSKFMIFEDRYPYHVLSTEDNKKAALWLRENYGEDRTIVAHRIGALGYFSGMNVIDLFGLVDREIALIVNENPGYHPNHARGDDLPELREEIRAREPDLMLTLGRGVNRPEETHDYYGTHWVFVRSFSLGSDQWWNLYEAKEARGHED